MAFVIWLVIGVVVVLTLSLAAMMAMASFGVGRSDKPITVTPYTVKAKMPTGMLGPTK